MSLFEELCVVSREDSLVTGAHDELERHQIATRFRRATVDDGGEALLEDARTVDGIVLLGGEYESNLIRTLQEIGKPIVIAGAGAASPQIDCVTADYLKGAEAAVNHFLAEGRNRIGLVNGPATTQSSAEKMRGYRLAQALQGIRVSETHVIASDFSAEAGYEDTHLLLQQHPNLDAILYAGDDIAMGGLHAIKETGKRVPEDVAVIGYYDRGLARFIDPPLTSVHVDLERIGRLAARRLQALIEQPEQQAISIMIPTKLVVRDSA